MLTPLDTALDQVSLLCGRTATSMGLIHSAYNTLSRLLQRNPQNGVCLLLLCENYWKQNQPQQESNHAILIDLLTKSLQHDSSMSPLPANGTGMHMSDSGDTAVGGSGAKNSLENGNGNSIAAGTVDNKKSSTSGKSNMMNSPVVNGNGVAVIAADSNNNSNSNNNNSESNAGQVPLSSNYLVWTYLAVAYLHTNQIDQSLKSITQATSLNPDEPFLWTLQTRIISRWYFLLSLDPQIRQQQGALPTIETLLPYYINSIEWSTAKRDPQMQLESHISLATLYFQFSLFDQSLAEMTFALNLLDSIQSSIPLKEKLQKLTFIYNFIAVLHQRLNDPNNALQFLQQVKDLAPTESHVIRCCITMSEISLLSNYDPQIEKSIALLTTELDTLTNLKSSKGAYFSITSNEEFMLRYILARCHSHLGNTETSYYQFQQLLKLFINHDYSPLVWTSIASLYLQLDQLADSLQAYSQAVQMAMDKLSDPQIVNTTSEFSNVYLSLKFYKLFAAYGWFGISQVYSKTDQVKDALNALEQSIELFRAGGDFATAQQLKQYYDQVSSQPTSSQNGTDHFLPPDIPIDLLLDFSVYHYMQSAFIVESLDSPALNAKIPGVDLQMPVHQAQPIQQTQQHMQHMQQQQQQQAQQIHQAQQAQQLNHASQSVSPPQLPMLQQHGIQQSNMSQNTSPVQPRVMITQNDGASLGQNIGMTSGLAGSQQLLQPVPLHVHPHHAQSLGMYSLPYVVQNATFAGQPPAAGPPPMSLGYIQHQQPQMAQAHIAHTRYA